MEQRARGLTSHRSALRRRRWTIVLGCMLLAVGACRRTTEQPPADRSKAELARLQRSTALIERQLELAGGKDFYLLLDPAASNLALMLRGAELRRMPVLRLQVGHPQVSWIRRRDPVAWQEVIWSDGELDPPRPTDRVTVTGVETDKSGSEPEAPPIPPAAEELYHVPPRFHIRFSGGLSLEIRPREADVDTGRVARLRAWWSGKWSDVVAVGSNGRDVVRLRVVLNPKDADSLYRSLPPSVRLFVLSGEPASAETAARAATPATRIEKK
jgi:hypothetical protein